MGVWSPTPVGPGIQRGGRTIIIRPLSLMKVRTTLALKTGLGAAAGSWPRLEQRGRFAAEELFVY